MSFSGTAEGPCGPARSAAVQRTLHRSPRNGVSQNARAARSC